MYDKQDTTQDAGPVSESAESTHKAAPSSTDPTRQPAWTQALGDHPPVSLQAKLTVNQLGDVYEQEADRVADQVMRMPATTETSAMPEDSALMRKEVGSTGTAQNTPPVVNSVIGGGGGQPLDAGTQATMESRFGHDFSGVRVHTDQQAAESAEAMNARAYTVGRGVVFGAGQYKPETSEGQRLLAHELTHVVQQEGNSVQAQNTLTTSRPGDQGEREAEAVTRQIMGGSENQRPSQITRQPTMIQRDLNYDLYLRGENYWFDNQGQARIAALARATSLGPGHTISHHPNPAVGLPHYHIIDPAGRQVVGHFFYGPHPPIKEREQSRYRERAREERQRRAAQAVLIGAGIGTVVGAISGAIVGAGGGTLVAPGVGTVGVGAAGAMAGAAQGAAVGGLIGGAVLGAGQAVWDWLTGE